ncbi:MAG: M81 family metallopeptidase [Burkholderiales bacterium]
MKIVIAQMEHETNTFSPVPTPWESFGPNGPLLGAEAAHGMKGTRTPIGAFLDLAEKAGAEAITPVAAFAYPSGPVDAAAYDRFCDLICEAVSKGCDAVFLDLHGAMVVKDRTGDGEGTLLEKVRAVAPKTPIAVSLDLHANVTEAMVANCDVIAGYKTYPHIDMYEAGERAGSILLRYMKGEVKPVMVWGNVPVLAQTLKMNTSEGAMKAFADAARQAERDGLLAASPFGGFPMADIPEAGMSTIVVADGDRAKAEAARDRILSIAWENREDFVWRDEPLEQAIAKAAKMQEGPVLLIDHPDNCASGATQDTMHVLKEALRQGLTDIGVGPIRDPEAVDTLVKAGIGAKCTLKVGGKLDMPAIGRKGEPLQLTGTVRNITNGEYTITGPQFTGVRAYMGRTVVFDTGAAEIVITERLQEPWDLGVFTSVGIDPARKKYLLLKSRMYFRPVFLPIAKNVVYCDGVGVASSDWRMFRYEKLRRPIYPLDENFSAAAPAVAHR